MPLLKNIILFLSLLFLAAPTNAQGLLPACISDMRAKKALEREGYTQQDYKMFREEILSGGPEIEYRNRSFLCKSRDIYGECFMNIIDLSEEEILKTAEPMWADLVKYSNKGQYGNFVKNFSYDLLLGLNEVEVGKQFAKSELTRSLSEDYDYLGLIRRGEHVTVLYRVRSSKKEGLE